MRYLTLLALFMCASVTLVHANDDKIETDIKDVSDKVIKKKGYCSPLDKMTGAAHCPEEDSSAEKSVKKAQKKLKKIDKKIQKRDDYCSPLDKLNKKEGCVE